MNVHTIRYPITSFLINSQGKLGLYQLLNLLQDAASVHAEQLGWGRSGMEKLKMFWVLTRQKLVMNEWPTWQQTVSIETWIRAEEGIASSRDFRIYLGEKLIGEATTSWLPLSMETRRPAQWDRKALLGNVARDERVSIDTGKVPTKTGGEVLNTFQVRNSDIDRNQHVNNTKYAQWILDAIAFDDHYKYDLTGYEVNFLLETHLGDRIRIERSGDQFQGVREGDGKIVFTSQITCSAT